MHSVTHWLHQLSFILLAIRQFDIQLLNLLDFYILKGLRLITCGLRLIPYGFSKSFLHGKRSNCKPSQKLLNYIVVVGIEDLLQKSMTV